MTSKQRGQCDGCGASGPNLCRSCRELFLTPKHCDGCKVTRCNNVFPKTCNEMIAGARPAKAVEQ